MEEKNSAASGYKCPCDPTGVDGVTRETCCASQPAQGVGLTFEQYWDSLPCDPYADASIIANCRYAAENAWNRAILARQPAPAQQGAPEKIVLDFAPGMAICKGENGTWAVNVDDSPARVLNLFESSLVNSTLRAAPTLDSARQGANDDERRAAWKNGYSEGFEAAKALFAAPQQPAAWDAIALAVDEAEKQGLDYVKTDLLRKLLVRTRAAPSPAPVAQEGEQIDVEALIDECREAVTYWEPLRPFIERFDQQTSAQVDAKGGA